jgi:hypothetical protein
VTLREIYDAIAEAELWPVLWNINPETYRMWKASAGNAKARRRWRRRDIPNSQRVKP